MKVREIAEAVGKKAVCTIGAAIAYSRSKTHAKERFNAMFGDV